VGGYEAGIVLELLVGALGIYKNGSLVPFPSASRLLLWLSLIISIYNIRTYAYLWPSTM